MSHLQAFEQPADRGTETMPVLRVVVIQSSADVFVAKALGNVIARQHGREQAGLLFAGRIEARVAAAFLALALGQSAQLVIRGCWILYRRQGFQVTQVASEGLA